MRAEWAPLSNTDAAVATQPAGCGSVNRTGPWGSIVADEVALTLESELVASTTHVSCELADEVVILSLSTGEYYGLNPVAARVWTLLQEPRRVAEIRDRLLDEYPDVTAADCGDQVLALLDEMVTLQLVVVR